MTLAAIRAQKSCGEIEVVIVDSQSEDSTVRLAQESGALVHVIDRSSFNHGLTRNLGAALSRGDLIAYLTQDALPADDGWLVALVESLEQERAAGAYSRVLPRPQCGALARRNVEGDLVFSSERKVKRATRAEIESMKPFERRVFFHFNNVSSMVRRSVLQRLPFPRIRFGEDLAWCGRVLGHGETIVYQPESRVLHSHESDLLKDHARHREDARLMRTLFGFRNRDGWRDCLPAWWQEVRRDCRYVCGERLGRRWSALLYSPFLRAAQIAGQWRGSHDPPDRFPEFPDQLPAVEHLEVSTGPRP